MISGVDYDLRADGVLTVTLNRPERRNAFDEGMIAELLNIFSTLAHDSTVRLLILKGAGSHFCAGFDLKSRSMLADGQGIALAARMYAALAAVPVLTVTLVQGAAYGGALGFVAASDMVIATRSARFACPEGRHGILPGVMAAFLARVIGPRHALTMVATAAPIPAERALSWQLVSELAEDEAALALREKEMIDDVLATGPIMARQAKALARLAAAPPIDPAVMEQSVALAVASRRSDEAREGVRAFREHRDPTWKRGQKSSRPLPGSQ